MYIFILYFSKPDFLKIKARINHDFPGCHELSAEICGWLQLRLFGLRLCRIHFFHALQLSNLLQPGCVWFIPNCLSGCSQSYPKQRCFILYPCDVDPGNKIVCILNLKFKNFRFFSVEKFSEILFKSTFTFQILNNIHYRGGAICLR